MTLNTNVPGVQPADPKEIFHVGDTIAIYFFGPGEVPQAFGERIKEDGNIMPPPPVTGPVKVAGRMAGDLQSELQEKYSLYYRNIRVIVSERRETLLPHDW